MPSLQLHLNGRALVPFVAAGDSGITTGFEGLLTLQRTGRTCGACGIQITHEDCHDPVRWPGA